MEDHFARLNTALTRGKPLVKLGVIHPVESYWLHWGPREQTALAREEMDQRFQNLCDWLLFGLCDFDYICESLLPSQCQTPGAPLRVGEMAYETILVPALETIRSTTLDRLEAFVQARRQAALPGLRAHAGGRKAFPASRRAGGPLPRPSSFPRARSYPPWRRSG